MAQQPEREVQAGLGSKGYGQGNFGTAIPPPVAIPTPLPGQASSGASLGADWTEACATAPDPIPATPADVEEWLTTFTPFTASNCMPPEIGQQVLWRGFKTGRSGSASTALEYFNGTVRDLQFEDNELFVYVT